jgi:hypothetical protein
MVHAISKIYSCISFASCILGREPAKVHVVGSYAKHMVVLIRCVHETIRRAIFRTNRYIIYGNINIFGIDAISDDDGIITRSIIHGILNFCEIRSAIIVHIPRLCGRNGSNEPTQDQKSASYQKNPLFEYIFITSLFSALDERLHYTRSFKIFSILASVLHMILLK